MPKFKQVSADEARAKAQELRRDHVRDHSGGSAIVKAAKAPTTWNSDRRSARFVMTTQQVDRYGDIVVTAGGDMTEFMSNPVGLLFHQSRTWPVANWENIEVLDRTRPPRIEGDFVMLPEGGPVKEVDECAWMIANGGIRACSIGFLPDWDEIELILDEEEEWITGFKFNKWEMLECSVCSIPANAGALAKSANGDVNLAKELLEDVLDNWVKTPTGLILSREDFEATHKGLSVQRTYSIVDKALVPEARTFVAKEDAKLEASTDEEAKTFVGAKVTIDPAHSENKDWPFDVLQKASGEVIDSYIVKSGENAGVHGLVVEFLTDDFNGMFRGIKAERFILVKAAEENEPAENSVAFDRAKKFADQIRKGDVPVLQFKDGGKMLSIERDGKTVASMKFEAKEVGEAVAAYDLCNATAAAKDGVDTTDAGDGVTLELSIDTAPIEVATKAVQELDALVDKTEKRVDGILERLRKFFGKTDEVDSPARVEPTIEVPEEERSAPPTDDEIAAARASAQQVHQRLAEKGLIAAA